MLRTFRDFVLDEYVSFRQPDRIWKLGIIINISHLSMKIKYIEVIDNKTVFSLASINNRYYVNTYVVKLNQKSAEQQFVLECLKMGE